MECRTGVSPEKMLERVNKLMCERSASNAFVTLFLFSLDAQGKGEYLGAGHNPVYLYRAATDEIEELHSEGFDPGCFRIGFLQLQSAPTESWRCLGRLFRWCHGCREPSGRDV